jgi:uncharacterized RDD family membrane protein YckC
MNAPPVYQLRIQTPEGVSFSMQLAGPFVRFLAWIVDAFCIVLAMKTFQLLLFAASFAGEDFTMAMRTYLYFVVSIGYGIAMEWAWRGQTVGKRLLRLRVMDAEGLRLGFSQIVVRNLLRAVDNLPVFYMVGGLACYFSTRAQRLGDLVAGTVVVRHLKLNEPALDRIAPDKFNSLLAYPHLAARLRQSVTPAEAALLVQSLVRRDRLDAGARLELYADLAEYFKAKVVFPQEAIDGISDEHYLKNVVAVVYRSR